MDDDSDDDVSTGAGGEARGMLVDIRRLTAAQFGQLGMAQIAYVKPMRVNGEAAFAIHAADGTPMAVAGDQDVAFAAIRQHEMQPAMVN